MLVAERMNEGHVRRLRPDLSRKRRVCGVDRSRVFCNQSFDLLIIRGLLRKRVGRMRPHPAEYSWQQVAKNRFHKGLLPAILEGPNLTQARPPLPLRNSTMFPSFALTATASGRTSCL